MAARAGARPDTRLIVAMIASTVVLLAVIIGGTLLLQNARSAPIDSERLGPRVQNTIVYAAEDGTSTTYSLTGEWGAWTEATAADAAEGWVGTFASGEDQVVYRVSRFGSHGDVSAFTQSLVDEATAAGGTVREQSATNTDGTGDLWIIDTTDTAAPVLYVWDNGRGLVFTLSGEAWPTYHMYVGHTL